jgi:hypothetical protein
VAPRTAETPLPPVVPVLLAHAVQTAAVAAYQVAALKADYLKLRSRPTKDSVPPGSPARVNLSVIVRVGRITSVSIGCRVED